MNPDPIHHTRRDTARGAALLALAAALTLTPVAPARGAEPLPVLMVIANRDFYYADYAPLRASLEAEGLAVRVAAGTTDPAVPHGGDPREVVRPDIALGDADAADYSAIVFVGGWGASSYQYAFPGTYLNTAYRPDRVVTGHVNALVTRLLEDDKPVAAICYGVSALAWARVDGVSPLKGRRVAAYAGGGPANTYRGTTSVDGAVLTRWHVETNGGLMVPSGSVGNPTTAADDVIVDGRIITGENYESAPALGRVLAVEVKRTLARASQPVLMVIANRDFWYTEYAAPRAALEAEGLKVEVAAGQAVASYPHAGSGYIEGDGAVLPDLSIAAALEAFRADADRYSAIVFVGGWGASAYQYAYSGTYAEPLYNGTLAVRRDVNELIGLFVSRGKVVSALCHGVSVLAYARVGGVSPLEGRTVVAWPGYAPAELGRDGQVVQRLTREHIEENGATMLYPWEVGDPETESDNNYFDGRFLTGESFTSAAGFGAAVAKAVLAQ